MFINSSQIIVEMFWCFYPLFMCFLRGYNMVLLTQPHMVIAIDESVGWHCWRKMTHQLQQRLCGPHVLFWFQMCSHVCIGVLRCQVLKMLFYWGTGSESYKYVPDGISVCKETFFDINIFMQIFFWRSKVRKPLCCISFSNKDNLSDMYQEDWTLHNPKHQDFSVSLLGTTESVNI